MYEIMYMKKTVSVKKINYLIAVQKYDIFTTHFNNHNFNTKNTVLLK